VKTVVSKLLLAPLVALIALSVGVAGDAALARAQEAPEVFLSTAVRSVLVDRGKQISFYVDVNNKTTQGRYVDLELVQAPEGWEPIIKDRGFIARSVWVRPANPDGPAGLTSVELQVRVPANAEAKDYSFVMRGTGEGFPASTLTITVGVKDEATKGTSLVVQYPTLRGKSGATFGFKADLKNDSEEERAYGLSFTAPEGWDVVFKPSYDQSQISSVSVKSGGTQGLDIQVTPPARVPAGEYPITVSAASPADQSSVELKVTVTGTYQMSMVTRTEAFSTTATAGEERPFYVTIFNTGSAPLQDISLSSYKPQGWAVAFSPDKIDALEPGANREVAMMIKPSAKAIAGDYMLSVEASHPQVYLDRDVRVTVETPTLWGWMGTGLLVMVIGGLMAVFMKIGRR
jgi:uncharacterized membrane protein